MCLGVPGRVQGVAGEGAARTGVVAFEGVRRVVCLAFVPEAVDGDWVLVHAGVAIARVDEDAAAATLAALADLADDAPERT